MKLYFGDATSITVQSVKELGGMLSIKTIGNTPDQLRVLFTDTLKTKYMRVEERGQTIAEYEGYTEFYRTEEYTGKIYGVVVNQVGRSTEERLTNVEEDVKEIKESGGVAPENYGAVFTLAKMQAQTLEDKDALKVKNLYETWSELVKLKFTAEEAGYKFTHQDVLYKTIKPGQEFQEQWVPGQGTESIFTRIDETHAGTQEDPIPYHVNMEVFQDKYYTEDGILYKCTRDSGQALHNKASELVGHYFELA